MNNYGTRFTETERSREKSGKLESLTPVVSIRHQALSPVLARLSGSRENRRERFQTRNKAASQDRKKQNERSRAADDLIID